jgi:hypothetical protein
MEYIEFELTYTACSGFSDVWTYTVLADDVTPPTFVAPNDITVYVNDGCVATGIGLGAPLVKEDNCSNSIDVLAESLISYPEGTTTVRWTATDCAGNVTEDFQDVTVIRNKIIGFLTYHNVDFPSFNSEMDGVRVDLYDNDNNLLDTDFTNANGKYVFDGLCTGTYVIKVDRLEELILVKGESNATDAAEVNVHAINPLNIESVRYLAGDVQLPAKMLTGGDAGTILSHFVQGENPIFNGDEYYWNFFFAGRDVQSNIPVGVGNNIPINMKVTIGGANIGVLSYDILGMLEGDFNGSFQFDLAKSASGSLNLEYGDYVQVESGAFELPMIAAMDMEVGAISLVMNFPADQAEITGVFMGEEPVMYNVNGNELRIGWTSLDAVTVNKGETLITLHMNIDETSAEGIEFSLETSLNELADANNIVIDNATLVIDIPSTSALGTGVSLSTENLEFTNHPNPFKGSTTLEYTLPTDGQVIIEVYNLVGSKVKVAVNETQSAGTYSLKLDASNLQPGVYTAILKLKNSDDTVTTRAIKMINR